MATLYFYEDISNNWDELGNWWLDSGFTLSASNLPSASDIVEIYSSVNNLGSNV